MIIFIFKLLYVPIIFSMEGGRDSGTRTHTISLSTDFESVTSTNFIISPCLSNLLYIQEYSRFLTRHIKIHLFNIPNIMIKFIYKLLCVPKTCFTLTFTLREIMLFTQACRLELVGETGIEPVSYF